MKDEISNTILINGLASKQNDNKFLITLDSSLTSTLQPGLYKLYLAGYSDSLSSLNERLIVIEAVTDKPVSVEPSGDSPVVGEPPKSKISSNEPVSSNESTESGSSNLLIPIVVALLIIVLGVVFTQSQKSAAKKSAAKKPAAEKFTAKTKRKTNKT